MNSVNVAWFIFSQTVFSVGSYAIMSVLFQLRFRKNFRMVILISVTSSIINYIVYFNKEADIGYVVPILSILTSFLYLTAVLKVPAIWSFVVTIAGGTIAPLVVQLGLILGSLEFFSPYELKEHIWKNYALDITSGLVFSLLAFLLYIKGWSFKFDFDKLRFKWEQFIIITISIGASITLPTVIIISHIKSITPSLTTLSIISFLILILFLGYALKKEKDENDFLNPFKEVK